MLMDVCGTSLAQRGHVVIVNNLAQDLESEAAFAGRLVGALVCTEKEWLNNGICPKGVQFEGSLKGTARQVAVSDAASAACPWLLNLLEMAAAVPGSALEVVAWKQLRKQVNRFCKARGARSRPGNSMRYVVTKRELAALSQDDRNKFPGVFCDLEGFGKFLATVDAGARCAGGFA